jgi:hypothetical protein
VRWTVAGVIHPETYKTQALEESRLAELRTHARNGVAFDVSTGLPVPEVSQARAEAVMADELSWYQHAMNYVVRRRKGLSGNSMRSIARCSRSSRVATVGQTSRERRCRPVMPNSIQASAGGDSGHVSPNESSTTTSRRVTTCPERPGTGS